MGATKLASKVDGVPSVDELRPITLLNTDYKLLTKWIAKCQETETPNEQNNQVWTAV